MVYAALILGGTGSLAGAVLGAAVVTVMLELLRTPDEARIVFYGVIALTLIARVRPWRRLAAVVAALLAFGYALYALLDAIWPAAAAGRGRAPARSTTSSPPGWSCRWTARRPATGASSC